MTTETTPAVDETFTFDEWLRWLGSEAFHHNDRATQDHVRRVEQMRCNEAKAWPGNGGDCTHCGPRPGRVEVAETEEEFTVLACLRGWCHDSRLCPICRRAFPVSLSDSPGAPTRNEQETSHDR